MVAFDLWVRGKKDEMSNKSPKGGVPPALSASQSKQLPDSSPGLTPDVQGEKNLCLSFPAQNKVMPTVRLNFVIFKQKTADLKWVIFGLWSKYEKMNEFSA